GRAVGVVLDRGDLGRHADLVPLEVDLAEAAFVAAAPEARGDAPEVVAAARRGLGLGERLDRLVALGEVGEVRRDAPADARGDRIVCAKTHLTRLPRRTRSSGPGPGSPGPASRPDGGR